MQSMLQGMRQTACFFSRLLRHSLSDYMYLGVIAYIYHSHCLNLNPIYKREKEREDQNLAATYRQDVPQLAR